jgi:hypothetical protein
MLTTVIEGGIVVSKTLDDLQEFCTREINTGESTLSQ